MFLGITFNNIRVSFIAFMFGLLLSFGTGWILMSDGIILQEHFNISFTYTIFCLNLFL
ncbi:MAG: hypothetical protein IPM14_15305 [bacterium]|nr:hypothetical protein [bacterium]